MALSTINKVREAELSAQKALLDAETQAEESEHAAEKQAKSLVAEAEEKARREIVHKEDKARVTAEEIMITSRNSTLLEVEKLKRDCAEKQDDVNKRVLEIII